ncbi:hypothetical protein F2Q70_00036684 [Brassica cretica]|uniref:Uncharacterized protein n=1 Tax=Brassica cretica TaxID=69181 RepID=A0A8S9JUR1_BRACR|nr:hypothetical protein F2Q70_00036684 [Brassica cretica]
MEKIGDMEGKMVEMGIWSMPCPEASTPQLSRIKYCGSWMSSYGGWTLFLCSCWSTGRLVLQCGCASGGLDTFLSAISIWGSSSMGVNERSEAVIAVASRFKGTFLSVARPALIIDWSRFVRSALGS